MYPFSSTFELHADGDGTDLMIRWGGLPTGSHVQLMFPQINVDEILSRTIAAFGTTQFRKFDSTSIELLPSALSFLSIPAAKQPVAALMRVTFPGGNAMPPPDIEGPSLRSFPIKVYQLEKAEPGRRVTGGFTVVVPLPPHDFGDTDRNQVRISYDVQELARIRAILKDLSNDARWISILRRYEGDIAQRLTAHGIRHLDVPATFEAVHIPPKFGRLGPQVSQDKLANDLSSWPRWLWILLILLVLILIKLWV